MVSTKDSAWQSITNMQTLCQFQSPSTSNSSAYLECLKRVTMCCHAAASILEDDEDGIWMDMIRWISMIWREVTWLRGVTRFSWLFPRSEMPKIQTRSALTAVAAVDPARSKVKVDTKAAESEDQVIISYIKFSVQSVQCVTLILATFHMSCEWGELRREHSPRGCAENASWPRTAFSVPVQCVSLTIRDMCCTWKMRELRISLHFEVD